MEVNRERAVALMKQLTMSSEAIEAYSSITEQDVAEFKSIMLKNSAEFFVEIRKCKNYRRFALKLYIDTALSNLARFSELGISYQVYQETNKDIAIWCENCARDYGEQGIEQIEWVYKTISMQLFRLGRLQFELIALDEEVRYSGGMLEQGQLVLNVHIPEGEPLDFDACQKSIAESRKFFKGITRHYVCTSWLLNPRLRDLLEKDSNIIRFQELFTPISTNERSRQAEERVFKRLQDNPSNYQEGTSLQRSLKVYLVSGGKIGETFGIFRLD